MLYTGEKRKLMPPQYILTIENLSKAYGKKEVLQNIWLSFYPGAKIGVIGGNGSGKSTLLRIMAGIETDYIGSVRPASGTTIGYLPQEPMLDASLDVRGNVETAVAPIRALLARFDEINTRMGEGPDADEMDRLLDEQAKVQDGIEAAEGWDLDRRIEIAMDAMRLPPGRRGGQHAFGRRTQARGACARSCSNGPTSCCSTSRPTTSTPKASPGWNGPCRSTKGPSCSSPTTATSSITSPSGSSSSTAERAFRGRATTRRGSNKNRHGWPSRKSRKARGGSSSPASSSGCGCRPGRAWPRTARGCNDTNSSPARTATNATRRSCCRFRPGHTWARSWSRRKDLAKAYGDNLLFENMNFRLPPGGIVGVIGPNGAGKTTLFRMITGQETADRGTLRVGDSVMYSYVDQNRDALNPENTIFQEITGGQDPIVLGKRKVPPRAYVAQFNFKGPDQEKKVGNLSGGERNRVHLAKLLKSGGNLLLLDEPTNDLDVEMLRALEEAPDRLRRLRRRHQPRPVVPGPDRHPYPRLRGRQQGRLVRRQLPDI